jgi:hypothetical protein
MKIDRGFYSMFDEFAYKLGLSFNALPFYNDRSEKLMGYIPYLSYLPDNKFGEKREEIRVGTLPQTSTKCNEMLAKAVLYKIQEIPDLEKVIKGQ